jgi:hypothetical protein
VRVVGSCRGLAVCNAIAREDDGLQSEAAPESMKRQLVLPHLMREEANEMPNERVWMEFLVRTGERLAMALKDVQNRPRLA